MTNFVKKFLLVLCICGFFFSCKGNDGDAQLKYSWVGLPKYFVDTNPSTPTTVINGVYFHTNPGKYYMEYIAFDNSGWYLNYEITINEGTVGSDGGDLWFEITLYSTGPTLYKWTTARNIIGDGNAATNIDDVETSIQMENSIYSTGRVRGSVLGKEEKTSGFGSIKIEYGKLLE
jgi:hypothetical protein